MAIPSTYAEEFARALGAKFAASYDVLVEAGKLYDKIYLRKRNTPPMYRGNLHAFIERETGNLIKPGGRKPQKTREGVLAVRFNVADREGRQNAVTKADPYGGYLYLR